MFDTFLPAGLQWYWKADFFERYEAEAINWHVRYAAQLPTALSQMHIYPINGAASRVGNQDTAWSYRKVKFSHDIVAIDADPMNNERMIQWAKEYAQALHPYALGGGDLNMIMDERHESVKAAYAENNPRLAQSKAKYDPNNIYHINQNILLKA